MSMMDVPLQAVLLNLLLSVSTFIWNRLHLQTDCLTTAIVRQDTFKKALRVEIPFMSKNDKSGRAKEGNILRERMKKHKSVRGHLRSTVLCVPLDLTDSTLHCAQLNILSFLWCLQCNFCRGLNKIFFPAKVAFSLRMGTKSYKKTKERVTERERLDMCVFLVSSSEVVEGCERPHC